MQNPSNKNLLAMPVNLPEATSPGDYVLTPLRAFRAIPRDLIRDVDEALAACLG